MLDLTVIILTKNEEKNIEKCLKSIQRFAKRIVVVDSFSTDNTKEICMKYEKIDFFEHEFENYAKQFDWAQNNTGINTRWIMRLDADEEVLPELQNEIIAKLPLLDKNIKGIILRRRVYFMGKWIKHGGIYPINMLRIFDKGFGKIEMKEMDEHLVVDGETITFEHDFIDYNTKSLDWWIDKHNWYSNREVKDCLNLPKNNIDEIGSQGKFKRWMKNNVYLKMPLFMRPKLYYYYRYYIKFGFLDGPEGRIFHFMQAYWYRFLVDAKIYEAKKLKINYKSQGSLND